MIREMFSTYWINRLLGQDVTEPEYVAYSQAEVYHEVYQELG